MSTLTIFILFTLTVPELYPAHSSGNLDDTDQQESQNPGKIHPEQPGVKVQNLFFFVVYTKAKLVWALCLGVNKLTRVFCSHFCHDRPPQKVERRVESVLIRLIIYKIVEYQF